MCTCTNTVLKKAINNLGRTDRMLSWRAKGLWVEGQLDEGRSQLQKTGLLRERLPEVGGRNEAFTEAEGETFTSGPGEMKHSCKVYEPREEGRALSPATSCIAREMD